MGPPGRAYLAMLFVVFGVPLFLSGAGYHGLAEALILIFGALFTVAAFSGSRGWAGSDRGAYDHFDDM